MDKVSMSFQLTTAHDLARQIRVAELYTGTKTPLAHEVLVKTVAESHTLDDGGGDAFDIRHRFVGCYIVGQIVLVDAAERAQERAQTCARSFTTVAMDFANAISIVITRPFLAPMTNGCVARMHARIVGRFIRIHDGALRRHISLNDRAGGRLVSMFEHPIAHLVGAATNQTQDRRPVIGVGALAFLLISTPARWVGYIRMGRTFMTCVITAFPYICGVRKWESMTTASSAKRRSIASNPFASSVAKVRMTKSCKDVLACPVIIPS
jgi:hypothetical protein